MGGVGEGVEGGLQGLGALLAPQLRDVQEALRGLLPGQAPVLRPVHGVGLVGQGMRQLAAEVLGRPGRATQAT